MSFMTPVRKTSSVAGIGADIVALRLAQSLGQIGFAKALGVDQSTLAKWEKDIRAVPIRTVLKLADIAPSHERAHWLALAGIDTGASGPGSTQTFPILRDPAAAGTARAVDQSEHAGSLTMPHEWFIGCGNLYALPVSGTSMEPLLCHGYLAVVDMQKRKPKDLLNEIVLARVGDGVTIKLLQADGKRFRLVPLNPNVDNASTTLSREDGILGRVVRWIGEPPRRR